MVTSILGLIKVLCSLTWFIATFRKILIHWKYLKVVENKFEGCSTYIETVFNLKYYFDIIPLFLPFYTRNRLKEKSSPEFLKLGNKLKRTLTLSIVSFVLMIIISIATSIVSFFIDIDNIHVEPDENIQAAHDFDFENDYYYNVVKQQDSFEPDRSKVDGFNEIYYDNGHLYLRGTFKDGKPDGKLEVFYTNGNTKLHRTYSEGFILGSGTDYYQNGNMHWKGGFKDNFRHGLSQLYYMDGNTIFETSHWEKGLPHGEFITYHKNGVEKLKGNFIRGKRNGDFIYYNDKGIMTKREMFVDDKKQ